MVGATSHFIYPCASPDFLDRLARQAVRKLKKGESIVIVCNALDEAGVAPNGNVFGLPFVLLTGYILFFLGDRRQLSYKYED
jgi:hypothetical protein